MEASGNPFAGAGAGGMTVQELADAGIHITNIMEYSATLELSAPKDMSKMYNFSGVKSNLPRDDINLQFCRGVLKDRKMALEDMKHTSFRRKAALNDKKEQKPQSERSPEWLADYQKNKLGTQQKQSGDFWKSVEVKTAEKEATPELSKGTVNAHKKKSKEEEWTLSLSDDTWYRAPQFHPEGTQARRTDIEVLCEIIYAHGERYDDGTAAIGFTWLFKMFNKANIVGILIKAKKHGLVFFDGEIVFASVRTEDDDEFVVLQKPIGEIRRAFNDMRGRHTDMFQFDSKRRATICLPEDSREESDEEDSEEESD